MTAVARNFVKDARNVGQGESRTLTSPGCATAPIGLIRLVKFSGIDRSGDTNKREIHSEADAS